MSRSQKLATMLSGVALLLGCLEDGVDEPNGPYDAQPLTPAASAVDISGAWNWREVSQLTMPVFVAEDVAGIDAEGPITHVRCEATGSMTLHQTGASFNGMSFANFQQCVTRGGQVFTSPDAGLPKVVADGQIRGMSVGFSLSNLVVTCPYQAIISAVEDGVALALSGTGRCILPGHPQSESIVQTDPPPGGTSKALSWEAVRP